MRAIIILAAGIGIAAPGMATAQKAQNTPEGIICATTGVCGGAATDGERVRVGDEKAFSLARPSAPAATVAPQPRAAVRAAPNTRVASAGYTARRVAPAKVQPGGGIDMLLTFPRGSAQLTPQAQAEARAFAKAMAAPQMAGLRFAIEGHTDASGVRDRNMTLSQARAQSVVDYLVAQGVDSSRLTAKGYGPDRPVRGLRATAPANRRVEFVKQS